jgi:D-glycero-beta-D-manno-heptose-7-phosphate kinase
MTYLNENGLAALRKAFSNAKVGVVGDLMLDRYMFGAVSRISPEAPVPILEIHNKEVRLGGAANVGHNIHTLGATPLLFGVVGDDAKGALMKSLLEDEGMSSIGIVSDHDRPTTVKTRVIAGSQQMLRIDDEKKQPVSNRVEETLFTLIESHMPELNAIVFEDYNKGVLSSSLIRKLIDAARQHKVPTFVDPKFDNFFEYKHTTVFKPNRAEMQDALGMRIATDEDVNKAGFQILEMLGAEHVLLTLSEKGMRLFERHTVEPFAIPTRAREVADVSGAGDTVIATLAVAHACGASVREAAIMANRAAGIVIEELGIVPIREQQLFEALEEDILDEKKLA